jgi:hypothetical protein
MSVDQCVVNTLWLRESVRFRDAELRLELPEVPTRHRPRLGDVLESSEEPHDDRPVRPCTHRPELDLLPDHELGQVITDLPPWLPQRIARRRELWQHVLGDPRCDRGVVVVLDGGVVLTPVLTDDSDRDELEAFCWRSPEVAFCDHQNSR